MNILISNDDGVDSVGIRALAKAMATLGRVVIVAPHRERSTAGHSLTLHKPLRIVPIEKDIYATSGTPADCIYLGTREVFKNTPDLILSGINRGANLGTDVHYSGTVAAAREGALMNIPSYAFSIVPTKKEPEATYRFDEAARWARLVVEKTHRVAFPKHSLINVNIPNLAFSDVKGAKLCRQGFRFYKNEVLRREDPRGKPYYWIGGPYAGYEPGDDTDCYVVENGFVSVTPITIDCTHNPFLQSLSTVDFSGR